MPSYAFNVYPAKGNQLIETVFHSGFSESVTIDEMVDYVRRSLIDHDGYPSDIRVVWPKGQTRYSYEFAIQGNYGYGWETECTEDDIKEARQRLKEYRENGPGSYRLRKVRAE